LAVGQSATAPLSSFGVGRRRPMENQPFFIVLGATREAMKGATAL
jgi:hypothetical protein